MKQLILLCVGLLTVISAFATDTVDDSEDRKYIPTVREDRVWVYWYTSGGYDCDNTPYTVDVLVEFKFEGTKEIEGVVYNRLVGRIAEVTTLEDNVDIGEYYLREEDHRVYIYLHDKFFGGYDFYYSSGSNFTNYNEALVCDFNDNERYLGVFSMDASIDGSNMVLCEWCWPLGSSMVTIDGEECKQVSHEMRNQATPRFTSIEGIGITDVKTSMNLYPLIFFPVSGGKMGLASSGSPRSPMIRPIGVYDLNGKELYSWRYKNLQEVDEIETDKTEYVQYFDMQGNSVNNLEEGKIYIRKIGTRADKIIYRQ